MREAGLLGLEVLPLALGEVEGIELLQLPGEVLALDRKLAITRAGLFEQTASVAPGTPQRRELAQHGLVACVGVQQRALSFGLQQRL